MPTKSFYDWKDNKFYSTLKTRVVERLQDVADGKWHDSPIMYLKTATILFAWVTSLFYMAVYGSFAAAVALGISASLIGTCIMHDGCHGAYSTNAFVNRLMGFGMDLIGASTYCWEAHHNTGHHPFTNLVTANDGDKKEAGKKVVTQENDPDVFSSYPLMRMNPYDEWRPHHRYQWLYAPLIFGGFTMLKVLYNDIVQVFVHARVNDFISLEPRLSKKSNYIRALFMKCLTLVYMLFLPIYFNGVATGIALFGVAHFFCGMILSTMFIVTHISDNCEFLLNKDKAKLVPAPTKPLESNWAAMQCRTSTNWALNSTFWTHFSGGLNHQIEHHLFPSISHVYYPYIQSVVESTCKEFNVAYTAHDSLFDALYHTLRWLYILGIDPSDADVSYNVFNAGHNKSGMKTSSTKNRSKSRRKGLSKSVVKKCDTRMHHT